MTKTILITGGSDGLGKALAKACVGKFDTVILSNEPEQTQLAAAEIGCDFVVADVSDFQEVKTAVMEVVQKHGSIDILVNNAGVWIEGALENTDPLWIQKVMNVNALGTMLVTCAVLPHMKTKRAGKIVNVISEDGRVVKKDHSVYCASKWAVTGFTKALELDLEGSGITIDSYYPGPIKTDIFKKAGVDRDMTGYMDPADAARELLQIIEVK